MNTESIQVYKIRKLGMELYQAAIGTTVIAVAWSKEGALTQAVAVIRRMNSRKSVK
jgi:hypothetical protein